MVKQPRRRGRRFNLLGFQILDSDNKYHGCYRQKYRNNLFHFVIP